MSKRRPQESIDEPASKSARGTQHLKLLGAPPRNSFVDTDLTLKICLISSSGSLVTGSSTPLSVQLLKDGARPAPSDSRFLTVTPSEPRLGSTGHAEITCRVSEVSATQGDYRLLISAIGISHALTPPFTVVRRELRVIDDPEWEDVWYKDEGGQSKAMTIRVRLVDSARSAITMKRVPLKLTLLYADGTVVSQQKHLNVLSGSNPEIDESGTVVCWRYLSIFLGNLSSDDHRSY